MTRYLNRKKRGYLYIRHYLQKKGLPVSPKNEQLELQKAQKIAQMKLSKEKNFSFAEKAKLSQWLLARGYERSTVQTVINL